MTPSPRDELVRVLRHPSQMPELSALRWDLLVRQARSAGLLPRLAWQFETYGHMSRLPGYAVGHFVSAAQVASAQRTEIRREVAHVQHALRDLGQPVVLLKGAAYLMAELPAACGRVFSDTDILLPKWLLPSAEAAFMQHGWATTHHSPYDQRYYRLWMHELPPLVHLRRQTALDVHHAIAPETARLRPDSGKLLAAAVPVPGRPGLAVLAPPDMVLHSMLHLLVNDELSHGLRDLSDLDLLLRHFGARPAFWVALRERADEMGLGRILHYATTCARQILGTPVPEDFAAAVAVHAPGPLLAGVMNQLWPRALRAPHRSTADGATSLALFALYVRAHWMRMPPGLLARHLSVKAWQRLADPGAVKSATP